MHTSCYCLELTLWYKLVIVQHLFNDLVSAVATNVSWLFLVLFFLFLNVYLEATQGRYQKCEATITG